jgi:putative endonuclease
MPCFVYILSSKSTGRYYVGSSSDPVRRLSYHNTNERGFTARFRPWNLVYSMEFSTRELAQEAERKIKSWKSKQMITRIVRGELVL